MQAYSLQTLARDGICQVLKFQQPLFMYLYLLTLFIFLFVMDSLRMLLFTVRNRFGASSTDCLKENTVNA